MTLLVSGVFATLAVVFSSLLVQVGETTVNRTRAQTAADAAALAAVAEAAPHGHDSHAEVARLYAERNSAELLSCDCVSGAYEVQVTVAVEGIEATARAEIDPRLFAPAYTASSEGLHPALAAAVDRLLAAAPGSLYLVSGFRSAARQEELWSQALAEYGSAEAADDWVAPPGHSLHERGLAVDLGGDVERAAALVGSLGLPLWRPLPHEPWHFELAGSRG